EVNCSLSIQDEHCRQAGFTPAATGWRPPNACQTRPAIAGDGPRKGTESSSAISFVGQLLPFDSRRALSAGRIYSGRHPSRRALSAGRIYSGRHRVASTKRLPIAVGLEHLSCGRADLEALVVTGLHRIAQCRRVESDFGSTAVVLDLAM